MDPYTSPQYQRAALVTIDTQRCTLDGGALEVPGTSTAVDQARQIASRFRELRRPIIHVIRLYRPDGSNAELCRKQALKNGAEIMLVGSEGRLLASALCPPSTDTAVDDETLLAGDLQQIGELEWLMYKPRWGAFFKTPLDRHLQKYNVSTLVICGCNFPNCPEKGKFRRSKVEG